MCAPCDHRVCCRRVYLVIFSHLMELEEEDFDEEEAAAEARNDWHCTCAGWWRIHPP